MLNALKLNNFKSAQSLDIDLKPLTVLTGLNGSGKSTVLQAIALVRQSYAYDSSCAHIALRGEVLHLGRSEDVLFDGADYSDEIALSLHVDSRELRWRCEATPAADTLISTFEGDATLLESAFKGFQYIQADRMTPAPLYAQPGSLDRDSGSLGSHGEYTVDYMSRHAEQKISAARCYPHSLLNDVKAVDLMKSVAPTDFLPDVVAGWLQLLSPGVRPIAQLVELGDSAALRFEYKGYSNIARDVSSRPHRPSNVGFGLTYILPIIVACLSSVEGSILLLENPEAHLHPRGQSALGLLLALSANDGVQIIVETHSDHVLNGIRLAAKRKDIEADKVAVHYFTRDVDTGTSRCESPLLLENGRFSDWPAGFFDEWDNALDELLGE